MRFNHVLAMIRKTVFLLLILTGLIPIACCPEQPTGPYKAELSQITLLKSDYIRTPSTGYTGSPYILPDETYEGDSLLLQMGFYYLLAHQPTSVSLHAPAMALSCNDYPGYTSLQDKIASVEIYSDQPFHEIPAGATLSGKVSVYNFRDKQIISLAQAITNMNTLHFYEGMEMGLGNLLLPGKPAVSALRTFTVRIAYESGRDDVVTSTSIRW
jgi:hypothetical protein